jgi:hypothetical protein
MGAEPVLMEESLEEFQARQVRRGAYMYGYGEIS